MQYGQNCMGGKCRSEKCDTGKIAGVENAGVEKCDTGKIAGVEMQLFCRERLLTRTACVVRSVG